VDHVRDPVRGDRGLQLLEIRHISSDERDLLELGGRQHKLESSRVIAEVVRNDWDAFANELRGRPRSDAAERAGDQEPLLHTRKCLTSAARSALHSSWTAGPKVSCCLRRSPRPSCGHPYLSGSARREGLCRRVVLARATLQVIWLACAVATVACLPFAPALVRELGDASAGAIAWTV